MEKTYCCEHIVETMGRVKSLEEWRDEYIISAQRWRDTHAGENRKEMDKLMTKLDDIETKLTTFVNPVLTVVISFLTMLVGILAGALWAIAR